MYEGACLPQSSHALKKGGSQAVAARVAGRDGLADTG